MGVELLFKTGPCFFESVFFSVPLNSEPLALVAVVGFPIMLATGAFLSFFCGVDDGLCSLASSPSRSALPWPEVAPESCLPSCLPRRLASVASAASNCFFAAFCPISPIEWGGMRRGRRSISKREACSRNARRQASCSSGFSRNRGLGDGSLAMNNDLRARCCLLDRGRPTSRIRNHERRKRQLMFY